MILITGGTGFIGSHLVEAACARGEKLRCLIRRDSFKRHPFALPAEAEIAFGDLVSGEGLREALEGAGAVIHLAGVTKALSTSEFYSGNARATENLARAVAGRGVRLVHVSSLAAIGPAAMARRSPRTPNRIPLRTTENPSWKGADCAGAGSGRGDRAAGRGLRPARHGRAGNLQVDQQGLGAGDLGGERWFQAIYVKDLADGLLAAARTPQAGGRAYFLAHAKAVSWSELSSAAARIMRKRTRVLRIPAPLAYAAGGLRGALRAAYREADDPLAREGERSALPPLDLRHAPRGARARLRSADIAGAWTCPNAGLVQAGGLAEVLNPDGRLGGPGKPIRAPLRAQVRWPRCTGIGLPKPRNCRPCTSALPAPSCWPRGAAVVRSGSSAIRIRFRWWLPAIKGDGNPDSCGSRRVHRPRARGSRLFDLACESDRLAGARPDAGAHGLSATCSLLRLFPRSCWCPGCFLLQFTFGTTTRLT